MNHKPSKNVRHTKNPGWSCLTLVGILTIIYTFSVLPLHVCEYVTSIVLYLCICMERGSSVVECGTRNCVSPGSNPHLVPFRRLGIFVLSIDAPVDSAVTLSTWL